MTNLHSGKELSRARVLRPAIRPGPRRCTIELTFMPEARVFKWRMGRVPQGR